MSHRHTVARTVTLRGIGLHSGSQCEVAIVPAPTGTGRIVRRMDLSGQPMVPATIHHVRSTRLATGIGTDDWTVSTVEHLLAALYAMKVDDVEVRVRGTEVPILDGTAMPWVEALQEAGRVRGERRKYLAVRSPIEVRDGDRVARILPGEGLHLSARIRFPHPGVGEQSLAVQVNPQSFVQELAWARTFGFVEDVDALRRMGLIQGGSLDNALVFGADGPMNKEGLRAPDEPVRHKLMDLLGDLALLGHPVCGRVEAELPGHGLTVALVRAIVAKQTQWELASLELRAS
jgi:UDP-3-O-[3-hydroxymyristoyl] N-acetylglucosamine deacetylase